MTKKPFKFPSYIQHDQMDCGPACLKIIAKYYGKTLSMKYLRDLCYITREGVSLLDIGKAAECIGLTTLALKVKFEDLKNKMPFPLIAHWKQSHFIVVYKISKKKVFVSDPALGLISYSYKDFQQGWELSNGIGGIMLVEPSNEFHELEEKESSYSFRHFMKYLKPYHKYLFQVFIGMVAGILISILSPFISQSIVDFGIGTGNIAFVNMMLIAGVVLAISSLFASLIQNRIMLYVSERINMRMVSDFLRKIMYLPVAFFERKMLTDILTRIADHNRIQSFIMNTFLGIFINILLFVIYSIIMLYYEKNMFFVFICTSLVYFGWILLFLKERKHIDNLSFEARAINQNDLLELLENVNEIKTNNISTQRRWKWELSRFKIYGLNIRNLNLSQIQTTGATFITQIQNVILTYIAAKNVIDGVMTLGMMMAAQHILGQLSGPISSLIGYVESMQFAKLSLMRVNEIIIEEKPEVSNQNSNLPSAKNIELKNLSFSYNPNQTTVLNDINLIIPEGKITAIVGESGSGKTTLLKLLLRFYEPTSGEISVGGRALQDINMYKWRNCIGSVLQDGKLFNDTILYNITLTDEEIDIDYDRLQQAVKLANVESFLENKPLKLYTPLGSGGSGLSQGQKQRILIARALYKNPDFIFLDEATNSLDANNEKEIVQNLNLILQGKTAIIIAHRLSTVKNADNIIVLNNGMIAEQGTHEELLKLKGIYYSLIINQLDL